MPRSFNHDRGFFTLDITLLYIIFCSMKNIDKDLKAEADYDITREEGIRWFKGKDKPKTRTTKIIEQRERLINLSKELDSIIRSYTKFL